VHGQVRAFPPTLSGKRPQRRIRPILARRIIVNSAGEIIAHELNSPFAYLRSIVDDIAPPTSESRGSNQIRGGALQTKVDGTHKEMFKTDISLCSLRRKVRMILAVP